MPDTIEWSPELAADIASLDALFLEGASRADGIARLREIRERAGKVVEARRDEIYAAYRATLSADITPDALETAAELFKQKQLAITEFLNPIIDKARNKLLSCPHRDTEVRELIQGIADQAERFIALYGWMRDISLRLAAEKRTGYRTKLHARPVEGNIDYEELIREHMARYPKIRAALAR